MKFFMNRFSQEAYAIFRFVTGAMFACHGADKLFGTFGGQKAGAPLFVFGGVLELVGGLLIAIGLLTSIAAFLCSGEMAVAYFMAHAKSGFWPIVNKGELAVMYCFAFLLIAAMGAGVWSVESVTGRRRR